MIIVQAKAIPKDKTSKNKIIEAAANLIENQNWKMETLTTTYIPTFRKIPYFS